MGTKDGRAAPFQQRRLSTTPRRPLYERFGPCRIGRSLEADYQGDGRIGPITRKKCREEVAVPPPARRQGRPAGRLLSYDQVTSSGRYRLLPSNPQGPCRRSLCAPEQTG